MRTLADHMDYDPDDVHDFAWDKVMQACIDASDARAHAGITFDWKVTFWMRNGQTIGAEIPVPGSEHEGTLLDMMEVLAAGYHAVGASTSFPVEENGQLMLVTALQYAPTSDRLDAKVCVRPLFFNDDGALKAIGLSLAEIDPKGFNIAATLNLLGHFVQPGLSESVRAQCRETLARFTRMVEDRAETLN